MSKRLDYNLDGCTAEQLIWKGTMSRRLESCLEESVTMLNTFCVSVFGETQDYTSASNLHIPQI